VTNDVRQALPIHFAPTKNPDYRKDSIKIEKTINTASSSDPNTSHLEITGRVELIPNIAQHSIIAATLSLIYWPEKNTPNAYAEIVIAEINQ